MEGDNESVQPAESSESQGAEGSGFYQEYLNTVPEDYRPHVEPYLKNIENNANSKFREHAEYRDTWKPYEELGISEYDPEALGQFLQLAEIFENPDNFRQWWEAAGRENGFMNETDDTDDDADSDDSDDSNSLAQFEQLLDDRLSPLVQREQQREMQNIEEQASKSVDTQLASLKEKHGEFNENAVLRFALPYSENDPANAIAKGFKDYQQFVGEIENGTVQRKAGGPRKPEGEGPPNTNPKPITEFSDAREMAKERLAQLR